jgi:hypothetical protein
MPKNLGGACTDRIAAADVCAMLVSLAECALRQVHGERTSCTERSLRPSRPQQGEMPLAVCVRRPEPTPRTCCPTPPASQRCKCSWLEGLRTVLDRVIDSHEQRGAL